VVVELHARDRDVVEVAKILIWKKVIRRQGNGIAEFRVAAEAAIHIRGRKGLGPATNSFFNNNVFTRGETEGIAAASAGIRGSCQRIADIQHIIVIQVVVDEDRPALDPGLVRLLPNPIAIEIVPLEASDGALGQRRFVIGEVEAA
jgi:hypothetical protein